VFYIVMPSPVVTTPKRVQKAPAGPAKRRKTAAQGYKSQPIKVNASQSQTDTTEREEGETFESQLRELGQKM
jgi:hypothetical protein